ncbi:hypothetical protein TCDM_10022 [Trypanosoma cruzi Dm28c]|uniref:Uncharacterized protein n=1 Tax=Trypanosoma cruzi Dm28c TaxID=1416333 RepID=V5B401_TRYCR|nr:hypothetical protein TCDM_10022 [Trypanosoma cruzi Dm28c]
MEREGEGRSTADTARERRQHEERAAGPAAQFTHHGTASTQGGHTTPAATMQEKKTSTTISPSSFPQPQGNGQTPRPPHNAHGASEPSSIHHAAQNYLPSRIQWDTKPNSAQSHAVHHTHRKIDSGCAPSLPSSSWPRRKTTAATRNCQHALQKEHSYPPQCASCVCVCGCVPAETQSKDVEKREQSMWRDAQKCTAGTHNGNNNKKTAQTHDCTAAQAAAIHTIFIENKKRPLRLM